MKGKIVVTKKQKAIEHEAETEEQEVDTKLVKMNTEVNTFLDSVVTHLVTDKETFDVAQMHLDTIKNLQKEVVAYWKPHVDAAFEVKQKASVSLRGLRDSEDQGLNRLNRAEEYIRKIRLAWKQEQDRKDQQAREKAEAEAQKKADKEKARLMKKAEGATDPHIEEKAIEKIDEVKVAPAFVPKTVSKSERSASGTLNTFVPVIEVEVHDIKSICGMVHRGELPVDCVKVSDARIKAWVKAFDKDAGMYSGFNVNKTEKERVTQN
jgi:hypothetical protein